MSYLKACLSVVLILGIYIQLFSQQIITGTVYTTLMLPLSGVNVYQGNNKSHNSVLSDINGEFAISIIDNDEKWITIRYVWYLPVVISDIDTISHPLTIIMQQEPYPLDDYQNGYSRNMDRHFGFITTLAAEIMFTDFSEFESALGNYNTDFMSGLSGTFNFEFAGTYKRYLAGVGAGISLADDFNNDSLKVGFNTMQYNLDLGYKILNTKRLKITPFIGLKWNRYRLTNSDINRKIPLESYLANKDLDIRFNQTYSSAALRIEYKPENEKYFSFWSVGVVGGYIFPLNKVPWTYSRKDRLLTDKELHIENYYFKIFIAASFD
jgi:hypothetical protein